MFLGVKPLTPEDFDKNQKKKFKKKKIEKKKKMNNLFWKKKILFKKTILRMSFGYIGVVENMRKSFWKLKEGEKDQKLRQESE